MEQLNKIELRGTVGSARLQNFNGKNVLHFTVATNYVYRVKDNEAAIETTWHNVCAWDGKDIPDLSTIEKGTKVYVRGRIKSQKYTDSEGNERYTNEVAARCINLIDSSEPLLYEQ